MRLIDADKLEKAMIESHKWHANNSREESLLARDTQIVKEQPTVNQWISVKDRLPQSNTGVLVVVRSIDPSEDNKSKDIYGIYTAYVRDDKDLYWYISFDGKIIRTLTFDQWEDWLSGICEITHWMPKLELPEEVKETWN